jgi:hypothetical protein
MTDLKCMLARYRRLKHLLHQHVLAVAALAAASCALVRTTCSPREAAVPKAQRLSELLLLLLPPLLLLLCSNGR